MIGNRITYRMADGVRVPGTWRHAFIRNFDYHLTDLFIYADGLIDCWGLVTLEEFEKKLRSGRVATELPEGAEASAFDLARWKFAEPQTWLTPEVLVAEIRDTIDQLNGRPDSTARCLAAVDVFLADPTEENRDAARDAYFAIPETRRHYALGDMDRKDWPLQVLVAGPGGTTDRRPDEEVTQDEYDRALSYFEERAEWIAKGRSRVPADGPATAVAPAVHLYESYPLKPSDDPGTKALRNEYPAPVEVDGVTYPTVTHAYWALSVADPALREAVAAADSTFSARNLAADADRSEDWERRRTAVMTALLRAKFTRHPELARALLATDDATIVYGDSDSAFWGDDRGRGRNWTGRLLELVRSELACPIPSRPS
ncbi:MULTISPECIES: NADAR family protein [unclassified Streptomyces]|uniref:NADAR family protein n=1 Tax=unclassified Streptomyces TaxID=2593676 RepID=UPI001C21D809|nr:NADAR family protein [Streptomyces sp. AC558_RSS880]